MTLSLSSQIETMKIGNDAGWLIEFYEDGAELSENPLLTLSVHEYHASIEAVLPSDIGGGSTTIKILGLIDSEYSTLSKAQSSGKLPLVAKLYLFWRDVNSSPAKYVRNLVGPASKLSGKDVAECLISVLSVTKLTRKVGTTTYDTEIHFVERAFSRLSNQRSSEGQKFASFVDACNAIKSKTGVPIQTWESNSSGALTNAASEDENEVFVIRKNESYLRAVNRVVAASEVSLNVAFRAFALIRNGKIHVGKRDVPLAGKQKDLALSSGLLSVSVDARTDEVTDDLEPVSPNLRSFDLTLKGRPDLKPGDLVRFDVPSEDVSTTVPSFGSTLLGAAGAAFGQDSMLNPADGYVTSVKHVQGATSGFVTTLKVVEVKNTADIWGRPKDESDVSAKGARTPSADMGEHVAKRVHRLIKGAKAEDASLDIAEVRSNGGPSDKPAQAETLWIGLEGEGSNGRALAATRLAVNTKKPTEVDDLHYLTPFAFGNCGLVLPRYPGMRVAVDFRHRAWDDPIEIGALWKTKEAPQSDPGDWWLSLPAEVPEGERASLGSGQKAKPFSGKASHDLIDADGNRVIEVGQLTIRFGAQALHATDVRPSGSSEENSVTIEHKEKGSKIVLKDDGSISIEGEDILIKAKNNVKIEATKVDVKVSDVMDVHG